MNRRSVLAGAAVGAMVPVAAYARLFGRGGAASGGGGGGGTIETTLTLVSTSGSTVSAGAAIPPFGLQFKKGDITTGTYPQLQFDSDDSVWPCTFSQIRSWSDGSMKHCSVIPACCPKDVTTGGITVNVLNGGSAPSASGRSRTEIYAANIVAKMTGAGSNFGLTGAWTAELENDANNFQKVTYGDGGGGLSERHWTKVNSAGTPHGQLECLHYVVAVNDTSGNLAGFWYLPRVWQPLYNQDTPAKNWRALSAFTIDSVGPGGSGTDTITPPFGYGSRTVTWTSGNGFTCNTTPDWYHGGGQTAAAFDVVPAILTTTGTLPTGWSGTQLYFVHTTLDDVPTLYQDSAGMFTAANASAGGSGTHTLTPVRNVLHFGSQFGATAAGKSNWIQAQGSVAAPGQVQVKFDPAYRRSTKCVLPYDLTQTPTSNLATFSGYTYAWDSMCVGPLLRQQAGAGDRDDIGPLTSWQVRHFYNQSQTDELYVRLIGLAEAHQGAALYDLTTHAPVNLYNASYTGLPSTLYNTFTWLPSNQYATGFTGPPAQNMLAGIDGNTTDHMPSMSYYAYLVTGEPVYLDLCLEAALGALAQHVPSNTGRNPTTPIAASGVVTHFAYTIRNLVWALRALVFADGIWPDTDPYGTGIPAYLSDCREISVDWPNTWITSGSNSYCATNGLWQPYNTQHPPWMIDYGVFVYILAYTLCEDANALTMLQRMKDWYNHIFVTWGGFQLTGYYELVYTTGASTGTPISDDDHFAASGNGAIDSVSWTNASPGVFTAVGVGGGYVVANGDKWIFPSIDKNGNAVTPPGGFSSNTPYYAVGTSGSTFRLADTPGGSAKNTSTSGSLGAEQIGIVPAAPTTTGGFSDAGGTYLAAKRGVMRCWEAVGITGTASMQSDNATRFAAMGYNFGADPKWAMQASW